MGGGHTPPLQAPPIVKVTTGSPTEGFLPQKYKTVSGEIIVFIIFPEQSKNPILYWFIGSGLLNVIQLQFTNIVGVTVGVTVGVMVGMLHGQTCKQEQPSESVSLMTTSLIPSKMVGKLKVYVGGILTEVATVTHNDNVISHTSISYGPVPVAPVISII